MPAITSAAMTTSSSTGSAWHPRPRRRRAGAQVRRGSTADERGPGSRRHRRTSLGVDRALHLPRREPEQMPHPYAAVVADVHAIASPTECMAWPDAAVVIDEHRHRRVDRPIRGYLSHPRERCTCRRHAPERGGTPNQDAGLGITDVGAGRTVLGSVACQRASCPSMTSPRNSRSAGRRRERWCATATSRRCASGAGGSGASSGPGSRPG